MRSLFASLIVAILFLVIALATAALGAVGVALIGALLRRWFDLTQWQGTLVALVIAIALALLLYKITHVPVVQSAWDDEDEEEEDEEDEEEPESYEPPIVPWRRSRPTPGELPSNRSQTTGSKPSGSSKTRK